VNLYPFRTTVTRSPPPPFEEGVENIDIGGPAMIRAAAKNHGDVTVIVDPADYAELLAQLSSAEGVSQEFRKKMAWKAYQHTASYDAQVCPGQGLVKSVSRAHVAAWAGFQRYSWVSTGAEGMCTVHEVCACCCCCCCWCAVRQVAEWLWGQVGGGEPAPALSVPMKLSQGLR
jgi:hypothetical protein